MFITAGLVLLLVGFHVFASRMGAAIRGAISGRRPRRRQIVRRARSPEHLLSHNESIDPE